MRLCLVQKRRGNTARLSTSTPVVSRPASDCTSGQRSTAGCAWAGAWRWTSATWAVRPTSGTWSSSAVAAGHAARWPSSTRSCARAVRARLMSRGICRCHTHVYQVSLSSSPGAARRRFLFSSRSIARLRSLRVLMGLATQSKNIKYNQTNHSQRSPSTPSTIGHRAQRALIEFIQRCKFCNCYIKEWLLEGKSFAITNILVLKQH